MLVETETKIERLEAIDLHGIRLHRVHERECVDHILQELSERRGGWVVTVNVDILRRFARSRDFAELCSTATVQVADGMPLVWASRMQGTPLPERVTGSNLIWSVSRGAATNARSLFLLGGSPGTAEEAAAILTEKFPGLRIAGTHCPPMGFEKNPEALAEIKKQLLAAQPDIVYVALGSPKQEVLIASLRKELPATWWLGVGISFSFVSGQVKRAPKWVQSCGMEWMHRMVQEPKRLARRYLVDDLPFVFSLFGHAGGRRLGFGSARGRGR